MNATIKRTRHRQNGIGSYIIRFFKGKACTIERETYRGFKLKNSENRTSEIKPKLMKCNLVLCKELLQMM